MTAVELVRTYLDVFCSGRDLGRLYEILGEDLCFEGPWHRFDSARAYVESLIADPPVGCRYEMLWQFEDGDAVNVLYELSKPGGVRVPISQLFEIRKGQIVRILVIFDTARFAQGSHD